MTGSRVQATHSLIQQGETLLSVASDVSGRCVVLSADDGAGETCVDLPAPSARRLILALQDALRDLED